MFFLLICIVGTVPGPIESFRARESLQFSPEFYGYLFEAPCAWCPIQWTAVRVRLHTGQDLWRSICIAYTWGKLNVALYLCYCLQTQPLVFFIFVVRPSEFVIRWQSILYHSELPPVSFSMKIVCMHRKNITSKGHFLLFTMYFLFFNLAILLAANKRGKLHHSTKGWLRYQCKYSCWSSQAWVTPFLSPSTPFSLSLCTYCMFSFLIPDTKQ